MIDMSTGLSTGRNVLNSPNRLITSDFLATISNRRISNGSKLMAAHIFLGLDINVARRKRSDPASNICCSFTSLN